MKDEEIARINELYKKRKDGTITPGELEEQAALRTRFIDDFKKNLRGALANVDIKEKDGSITHVKDIPVRKEKND